MSKRYGIIEIASNTCINIIDDEDGKSFEILNDGKWFLFESPEASIGMLWNGTNLVPGAVVEPPVFKTFTKLEFRNLFTLQERVAIDNFELNPSISDVNKMTLRTLFKDQEAAMFIDVGRTDTQQGIQFLNTAGLISTERANQILNATNSVDRSK